MTSAAGQPANAPASLSRRYFRPWRLLAVLLLLGAAGALGGPQLWAWYHFRMGRSALERYDSEPALDHLNRCLRVWPNSISAHLLAARAARRNEDFTEAEQHLRRCQALRKDQSDETVLEWALFHASGGDLAEVEQFLQEQTNKGPAEAALAWEALAHGYIRVYRTHDAFTCLNRWLEQDPDNVQALALRGGVWMQAGSALKAAADYRRVVELAPGRRWKDRWQLVLCLLDIGRYDEALPHLEDFQRRQPGDPEVLARLARCQVMLGRSKQARELLDEVLQEHPDHALSLRSRGQLALMVGRPADAEKWLTKAVRLTPYDYLARHALAQALRQQHKNRAAEEQQARAERLKDLHESLSEITTRQMPQRPYDPALHCKLGVVLLGLGHQEVGLRWLLGALRLDPTCKPAHEALANYYEQGDPEKAAYHRQEAGLGGGK
jgi:tetratricopeptide (TPR) repeat protein